MPSISEVGVRFMRRIQVRDYEPAESEVTLKAVLLDGENAREAVHFLQDFASEEVHQALGLPTSTKLPVNASRGVGQQIIKGPFGAEPHSMGVDIPAIATEKPVQAAPAGGLEIPTSTPAAAPASPQPASAGISDIPESKPATTPTAAPATNMTAADVSKWIGEQVRSQKVSSEAVKGLYPKYKVTRFADLKPEQIALVKADVEEMIAKKGTPEGVVMA